MLTDPKRPKGGNVRYPRWAMEVLATRTYCVVTHKVCHPSKTQAKKAAHIMRLFHHQEFYPYVCPFCEEYHITSQEQRGAGTGRVKSNEQRGRS